MQTCFRVLAVIVSFAVVAIMPAPPARAGEILLNFSDLSIPGGTDTSFFTYSSQGFSLTAINPPTGFLSGFQAHGPNSTFFMGKVGVAPFAPATAPDNVITLTQDNGQAFSLLSIDLARNFPFDPAPTVTFTGTLAGGGTVSESFTVTTPSGVRAFQTFDFTGFGNVVSVSWTQPVLSQGIHQFTDIRLASPPVPEPAAITLMALGIPLALVCKFCIGRGTRIRDSSS